MNSAARITRPPKVRKRLHDGSDRMVRLFSVDEYHRLGEAGILTENDRCELIRGLILEKPVINPPHKKALRRVQDRLKPLLAAHYIVDAQGPITLSDSEPEPDLSAAIGPEARYDDRHAGPGEVVFVLEISDSSLITDQGEKLRLYARAKIPVYWIVDIGNRRIEVYTLPRGGKTPTYRSRADYGPDDSIPVIVGGKKLGTIKVNDLLP